MSNLTKENAALQSELDILRAELDSATGMTEEIRTMESGKYLPAVRQCCMELLASNVGIFNVRKVVNSVLAMVGKSAGRLPSHGLLSQMYVELKGLASLQLAEELSEEEDTTLHTDGTTKHGYKYGAYQISTKDRVYSIGMVDMERGTAEHTLEMFKAVLGDVGKVGGMAGVEAAGEKILTNLKNTMSDRSIVEKVFNTMLEQYRGEVLPLVHKDWEQLNEEQKSSFSTMNHFFCGLHYIVGLADQADTILRKWEDSHFTEKVGAGRFSTTRESATHSQVNRLIYSATKAFEEHGDEAAGVMGYFRAYLRDTQLKLPLREFRGNRNYVLFYNGAGIGYLHDIMRSFLVDIHGESNQLLRAVKADLDVPELVAGCRALGLICKLVVSPLWAALEDKSLSVFDMSAIYSELVQKMEGWAMDATAVLEGSARPFKAASVDMTDTVLSKLIEANSSDACTLELLQVLFAGLSVYSTRILADHLPGGCFHEPSGSLATETESVRKTNAICESDFGKLDRYLREKPNIDTVAVEGLLMFSNNQTASWLSNKTEEEREELMTMAMHAAPAFRLAFKDRQRAIQTARMEQLKKKEADIARRNQQQQERRETLTAEVTALGGLWTSQEVIADNLAKMSRLADQRQALRSQLFFRKFVIQQNAPASVFQLSSGGKQLSVDQLVSNLVSLL